MKRLVLAATIAAALMSGASAASSAQYQTFTMPEVDGSFSGTFGFNGVNGGVFSNIFMFNLPTGASSFTASSSFTDNPNNDINFTSIDFNGTNFNVGSTGQVEFRFLTGALVTAGPQTLTVKGTSGGNGSYAGSIAFTPAAGVVPEPAAWALMIVGFGGTGVMLRRRQKVAISAA